MFDEFEQFGYSHVFAAFVAVIFGWGALWVGSQGAKILNLDVRGVLKGTIDNTVTAAIGDAGEEIKPFDQSYLEKKPTNIKATSSLTAGTNSFKIIIGGDVMTDRQIRKVAEKSGYGSLLSSITPLLKSADISVINLEGPITSNPSKTLLNDGRTTKELLFTFATTTAKVLSDAGITAVSLANNHTDNFGAEGFQSTKDNLTAAGVFYFGDPWNNSTEKVMTKNGVKVAFVGYHAFQKGYPKLVQSIKKLADEGNFVIVMPHWGTEYVATASPMMKGQAHELASAGAGAIIGSHSHVIGEHEWIKTADGRNVPVFYSLGNLLFDQYFSQAVMKGNLAELDLVKTGDKISLDHIRVYETSTASRNGVSITEKVEDEYPSAD